MPAPPRAAAGDPPSSLLCDAEMVSFINAARTRGAKTRYISLMRFASHSCWRGQFASSVRSASDRDPRVLPF